MGRVIALLTTASLLAILATASAAAAPAAADDPVRNVGNTPAGPFDAAQVDAYRVTLDLGALDGDADGDGVPRVTGVEKHQIKRGMVIAALLKKGDRVALVGFGASERKGRNPQTGKEIKIPAKRTAEDDGGRHTPFHGKYRPGVADLDGDGHPDIAVANPRRSGDALTLTAIPLPTGHPGTDTALERCAPATNTAELIDAIASAADITKADATRK